MGGAVGGPAAAVVGAAARSLDAVTREALARAVSGVKLEGGSSSAFVH